MKVKNPLVVFVVSASGAYLEGFSKSAYPIMRECQQQGLSTLAIVNTPELKVKFEDRQLKAILAPTRHPFPYGPQFLLRYELIRHRIGSAQTRDPLKNYERELFLSNLLGCCLINFNYAEFFYSLYRRFKPALVFAVPDKHSYLGETSVQVARNLRIPSLTTLSTMVGDYPDHGRLLADKLLATGRSMKRVYLRKGVNPNRIVTVGNVAFDALYDRNAGRDRTIAERCGVPAGKRIVMYATDALYVEETNRIIGAVNEAVQLFEDVALVIKVHPREPIAPYLKHEGAVVVRDIPLYPLLNSCELLITGRSMVALEALALGKQVITVNLSAHADVVPYAKNGVIEARSLSEVLAQVEKCLRAPVSWNRGVTQFVDDNLFRLDGRSAQRAVAAIKENMLK